VRRRVLFGVIAGVLAVSVGTNVWLALRIRHADAADRTRTEVAKIARDFLFTLTNFQASTIDHDVARIRSYAVGDFAQQVQTFFDAQAVATIKNAKAKSTGEVQSVFVEGLSGGTSSVFGLVNETVTNSSQPSPRAELVRIEVQLIDTKGGWRVNKVNILEQPSGSPLGQ
jgi:hypothetical protein